MALDFIASADGTKIPTRTRTDGAPASGTVEAPEGVTDYLDGSGNPTPVSATTPMPITTGTGVTLPVSATVLPLPTGAATESTLSTLNGKVTAVNTGAVVLAAGTAIAGKFTTDQTTHGTTDLVAADITKVGGAALSLGQQLAAASVPVILPAATVTTLTPPTTVTVTQGTGTNLHVVNDAGTAIMGKVGIDQTTPGTTNGVQVNAALPTGANTIGNVGLVAGSAKVGQVAIDHTTPGTTDAVVAKLADTSGNGITSGSLNAGAVRAVDVIIRDSTGAQVSSFGGNSVNLTQVNGTAMLTGGVAGSQGVGGLAANAAALAGNPVLIGGSDGTNARTLQTDTLGFLETTGKSLIVGPTSLSGVGTLIAATDSGDMSHVTIQLTGTFSLTVVFEQSIDNTNWVSAYLARSDSIGSQLVTSVAGSTAGIWGGTLQGRYFRARVSAYTSGTITATADFGSAPVFPVNQQVQIAGANGSGAVASITPGADGNGSVASLASIAFPFLHNNSSFDRQKNNYELTVFTSAARTTTQTSADLVNFNGSALKVVVDVTVAGTGSITVAINGKSTLSGKYFPILTSAAITTNSTTVLTVAQGATAVANVTANDRVPRIFQVVVTANNANTITYSVDAQILV